VGKEEHMAIHLKRGDRVMVPWGLDEVKGVVLDIYGPPGARHVLVRVPVMGSTGETLEETEVSYPSTP
jgi:primosomal protein N'